MTTFLAYPIELVWVADLYEQAFRLAGRHRLPSVYDGLYVVLAQLLHTELWTADERLLTSLGTAAPWVRWIGDYPQAS